MLQNRDEVKDILDFIGLVEGINYSEQSQISDGSERSKIWSPLSERLKGATTLFSINNAALLRICSLVLILVWLHKANALGEESIAFSISLGPAR